MCSINRLPRHTAASCVNFMRDFFFVPTAVSIATTHSGIKVSRVLKLSPGRWRKPRHRNRNMSPPGPTLTRAPTARLASHVAEHTRLLPRFRPIAYDPAVQIHYTTMAVIGNARRVAECGMQLGFDESISGVQEVGRQ
jgi:hypothetical protein